MTNVNATKSRQKARCRVAQHQALSPSVDEEIICSMRIQYLSVDEILGIHERVARDFADTEDPFGLAGPRDGSRLLESAVSRQMVGIGEHLKYSDPLSNAATLTFGLCCGHPFHNGNKRTALVAMLAHLERNGFTLSGTKQRDLYTMIKAVASHSLGTRVDSRKKRRDAYTKRQTDTEVAEIARWLERHTRKIERGERHITYRQLRQIVSRFGFFLEHPKGNSIGVYREVNVKRGLLKTKSVLEKKRIGAIGYPGEKKVVPMKILKQVRRMCELDDASGCDAAGFYEGADIADAFIVEYQSILAKLASE
jgi:death-on-curing protein